MWMLLSINENKHYDHHEEEDEEEDTHLDSSAFQAPSRCLCIAMASAQVFGKAEPEAAESRGEKWIEDASDCRDLLGFVVCYCLLFVVFVASCPFTCFVVLLCGSFDDYIDI